jgi:arylsulfatase
LKSREQTFEQQKKDGIIPGNAVLTKRPDSIPAWDSLNDKQKKLYSRMMEVYAAALSYMDNQINRILDAIEETGELDNTLVIYIQGDNGASAEGGPNGVLNEMTFFNAMQEDFDEVYKNMDKLGSEYTFNHFPAGWAHATNTPFQWTKQIASHFGGTRNGLVISWPKHIKNKGEIRSQFHHVIDIMPTILDVVGLESPAMLNGVPQKPIEGVSMAYSFDDPKIASKRRTQYFEMLGNRAIYNDGWVAGTTPPEAPWSPVAASKDVLDYEWELYNVAEDFTQSNNLAKKNPEKLRHLQDLFWAEAARYNVLPLDNSKVERGDVSNRPSLNHGRTSFTYYPGMVRIPEGTAPDLKNRSYRITAEVEIPETGAEGLLLTQGGRFGGLGFYILDSKPVFHYNAAGVARYTVASKDKLQPGKHSIVVDFKYDGGGIAKGGILTMTVDDKKVAEGRIERTLPFRISLDETFDIGEDTGTPVSEDYKVPFQFNGKILKVVVDL